MSEPDLRVASRAWTEQSAMNHIVERLAKQFPELPQETISDLVQGKYANFEKSKIRDFVPILVERTARDELAHAGPPRHRA